MKKIIISLAAIGMIGAMVAGATGAFFSGTVTSQNNTFNAGTLTFNLDGFGGAVIGPLINVNNLYPGAFAEGVIAVNDGGISINPELSLLNPQDPAGMAFYMRVEVWTNSGLYYSGPVSGFPGYAATHVITDRVPANGTGYIGYRFVLDESAQDSVQGGSYSVNLAVTGHQFNDPASQPTALADNTANGFFLNGASAPVCGVRDSVNMPTAPAGQFRALYADDSNHGSYNSTAGAPFSAYYSYNSSSGTPNGWVVHPTDTFPVNFQNGHTDSFTSCTVN